MKAGCAGHIPVLLLCVLGSFVSSLAMAEGARAHRSLVLTRQSPDGWEFSCSGAPLLSTKITIEGKSFLLFEGASGGVPAREGEPLLPAEVITLGIPADASVTAELKDVSYESVPNQLVAPQPSHQITEEREAISSYRPDPRAYGRDVFYPSQQVISGSPVILRQQRMVSIRFFPCQYNPATRTIRRVVSGKLVIRLTKGQSGVTLSSGRRPDPDPYFDEVFKGLLLNYSQAREWRNGPSRRAASEVDSTRGWFEKGMTYYRIPIARDGWYRVTLTDFEYAGINIASVDTATLRLYSGGRQVPFRLRPDLSVEFYGMRNAGDSTYLDFYTDTTAYWLTWGGGVRGSPFVPVSQPAGAPVMNVGSSWISRHFEENTDYYEGTGESEVIQNGPVPGEGWVWEYYYPNSTFTHTFLTEGIDVAGAPTVKVRVRLFSSTLHYSSPDHLARVFVNDSLAGEVAFDGRRQGMLNVSIPSSWLNDGTNLLRITSIPTPSIPNQFYLDWFEVEYRRFNRAVGDECTIVVPPVPGGGVALVTATGFSDSVVEVFDPAGKRIVTGGVRSGDAISGFTLTFHDTLSVARTYHLLSPAGGTRIPSLLPKTFVDLRTNAGGADYIIVTHRTFLEAANQLAAHRRTLNGVRTAVVDVQDIYDEFNYGILDAAAVKNFLRFAYEQWARPAPAYLLLLGDASWDFHKYMSASIKTNFVPAYGVPAGDNWFACFDSLQSSVPSLIVGRIPVQDEIQARRTVEKVKGYDAYILNAWNKSFLFISGGTSPAEQASFNGTSDLLIRQYVDASPLGGASYRVYKSTPDAIDGENKQLLRDLVRGGLVFMNFLGHSGGRVWGVDIGSPNDLENTNGELPFVTSVSCNVGGFAEPSNNVLSEDFVLADNRGAIGMWASSSLGYASIGSQLVAYFLEGVTDSVRGFGSLTTTARLKLWQSYGPDPLAAASMNLNPLLGDPLSSLAIPLRPDLAVSPSDITVTGAAAADSVRTVRLDIHNYGLVPADSVGFIVTDTWNGTLQTVVGGVRAPIKYRDSVFTPWRPSAKSGLHLLSAVIDPGAKIPEVRKTNNTASIQEYVFTDRIAVIRPLPSEVVSSGPARLVVSRPLGLDTADVQYTFEADTVATFDSPGVLRSGAVQAGPVNAEWLTPPLDPGIVLFWRARTIRGALLGEWATSSLSVSRNVAAAPAVRVRQYTGSQFALNDLRNAAVTGNGVTILPVAPLRLGARSLGYRAESNRDYYSVLRINDQTIFGLWWVLGSSFMAARVNEFNGSYDFRPFDLAAQVSLADSMTAFINATPVGNYLAFAVVFDGRTNVNPALRQALRTLGSHYIDSLQAGHSWIFVTRKGGGPTERVERWSPDGVAEDSIQVPNYYRLGSASVAVPPLALPVVWKSLHWRGAAKPGTSGIRFALTGAHPDGGTDTLWAATQDSADVDVSFLNDRTFRSDYVSVGVVALLTSADVLVTPVLREWWLEYVPPPDLAISPQTVGIPGVTVEKGKTFDLPVTVHNDGYSGADSVHLLAMVRGSAGLLPVASAWIDSVPANSSRTVVIPVPTAELSGRVELQVEVTRPGASVEILASNNLVLYAFTVAPLPSSAIQIFSDGVQLMDGDYVASSPQLLVRIAGAPSPGRWTELFVDGVPSVDRHVPVSARQEGGVHDDPVFSPQLTGGRHELRILVLDQNLVGAQDSVARRLTVQVSSEIRILQVFNYPNPFDRETEFTFVVAGPRAPEEVLIRIFTLSGRKIRELSLHPGVAQIGFNRVVWDGRDNDGDDIANGTYLYQVQVKGGGKTETAVQKLVKLR